MKAKIYVLFSSSKGNCTYIKNGKDEILIDMGVSARRVNESLCALGTSLANISAVFVTHEHTDHIKGLGTLSKYFSVPIYAPPECCEYIAFNTPCTAKNLVPAQAGEAVWLEETAFYSVPTPHDARKSVGFRINLGDERAGYFTDIGCLTEGILRGLSGCSRVVLESNHDVCMLKEGSYPLHLKKRILGTRGHLSNAECAQLLPHLAAHGTRSFVLAHLSEENNRPELALAQSGAALTEKGFLVSGLPHSTEENAVCLRVAAPDRTVELV